MGSTVNHLALGKVWHRRQFPRQHAFAYDFAFLDLDLMILDQGNSAWHWPSIALLRVQPANYLEMSPISSWQAKLGAELEKRAYQGAILGARLLTMPRILHWGFNPVSFFLVHRKEGNLILLEVGNTYGSKHLYVCPASGDSQNWHAHATLPKEFFVSPFNPVEGHYEFELSYGKGVQNIFRLCDQQGVEIFSAGLDLDLKPLNSIQIGRVLLSYPAAWTLASLRIMFHAGLLFFKHKLRHYPEPVLGPQSWQARPELPLQKFISQVLKNFKTIFSRG